MKESERLIAAKALIADERNWTQEVYARNAAMKEVSPLDPTATCFCSLGALRKVSGWAHDDSLPGKYFAQSAVYLLKLDGYIDLFNDNNTHEAVMEMFDLAIKLAQDAGN